MSIYKFSRVVAAPFVLALIYFIYLAFTDSQSDVLVWMLIPIAILVLIYLFQPQIDFWWLRSHPLKIEPKVLELMNRVNPLIRRLDFEGFQEWQNRLILHMEAKSFMGKGSEDFVAPYDVKAMLSQVYVTMSYGMDDYLLDKFKRIIIYKHPFPSPRFKFLHAYETQAEDGVIIVSLEHVEKGLMYPESYYNVAWHVYAEAFIKANPSLDYPMISSDFWEKFEQVCGFEKEQILLSLGFESIDPLPSLVVGYFNYGEKFQRLFPEESKALRKIFGFASQAFNI